MIAAENTTVRPPPRSVRRSARSGPEPAANSSRYLLTSSRLKSTASPKPSAVVMFRAKSDTSVVVSRSRRNAVVAATATTPTTTGSRAAVTLPSTHRRMSRTSGTATNSA